MRTSVFLLALLLSAAFIYSQTPSLDTTVCEASSINAYWEHRFGTNWVDICALGVLISFFMISIIYMYAHAFGKPDLAAWCRVELFQVFVSLIMLASLFWFINLTCTLIKPSLFVNDVVAGSPEDDLFLYAETYLDWLRDATYTVYYLMAIVNGIISGVASVFVNSSPGGFGVALRPLSGFTVLSSMMTFTMSTLLVGGVLPTMAQIRMLQVIKLEMFNLILPIGIIARCVQPLRRFGGAMIALAIGLYLFYPFLLVLNAGVVHNVLLKDEVGNDLLETMVTDPNTGAGRLFTETDELYYRDSLSLEQNKARNKWATDEGSYATSYDPDISSPGPGYQEMTAYENIYKILYTISLRILMASLFLPLLNFILLTTFILNLSRLLGEEVDVSSITRMI